MMDQQRKFPPNFGEPAPWFTARTAGNPRFVFHSVAGRHVVLAFPGAPESPFARALQAALQPLRPLFDDANLCYFGVCSDPGEAADSLPGIRHFHDPEQAIAGLYRLRTPSGAVPPTVFVLDAMLRVIRRFDFDGGAPTFDALTDLLRALPKTGAPFEAVRQAPVLVVPRVFEPGLCRALIDYYATHETEDSGFMREVDGKTVAMIDYGHKRRRDCQIEDAALRDACRRRIFLRLVPEIHKAFQFRADRIERDIVACYDSSENGHFRAHRDNTTPGTAHRKFAVSLFLNAGDYDGGQLRFPEFGPALYSAPRGGAVVFSCGLLHEATAVTGGARYMYLPFLYDAASAQVRQRNASTIVSNGALAGG